jgi:hypothetical protein
MVRYDHTFLETWDDRTSLILKKNSGVFFDKIAGRPVPQT